MNKIDNQHLEANPPNLEDIVWQCLKTGINRFNQSGDSLTLLCPRSDEALENSYEWAGASERAITHRLAFYIECELRSLCLVGDSSRIVVDCEYNRHIGAKKSLAARAEARIKQIVKAARHRELEADDDGFYVFSIAPDIVVHERRNDDSNVLVVEVKKRSNQESGSYDALKLELFTSPKQYKKGYGYMLGAWVVAEDECSPQTRKLIIEKCYKDGIPTPLREDRQQYPL